MHRTQIYLDDEIYTFLESERKRTDLSYSEIIRLNIKSNINNKVSTIIKRMEKAAGSWAATGISPEDYISGLRKDRRL